MSKLASVHFKTTTTNKLLISVKCEEVAKSDVSKDNVPPLWGEC